MTSLGAKRRSRRVQLVVAAVVALAAFSMWRWVNTNSTRTVTALEMTGEPGARKSLLTRDSGGGAIGARNAMLLAFASQLECHTEDELSHLAELRRQNYQVRLSLWLFDAGLVERARIDRDTGHLARDREIRAALERLSPLQAGVPSDVVQPVRLRNVTRGANCGPASVG